MSDDPIELLRNLQERQRVQNAQESEVWRQKQEHAARRAQLAQSELSTLMGLLIADNIQPRPVYVFKKASYSILRGKKMGTYLKVNHGWCVSILYDGENVGKGFHVLSDTCHVYRMYPVSSRGASGRENRLSDGNGWEWSPQENQAVSPADIGSEEFMNQRAVRLGVSAAETAEFFHRVIRQNLKIGAR